MFYCISLSFYKRAKGKLVGLVKGLTPETVDKELKQFKPHLAIISALFCYSKYLLLVKWRNMKPIWYFVDLILLVIILYY
jgi:hypothetical protein